jgi:ribose 5-phosphate isomerase B
MKIVIGADHRGYGLKQEIQKIMTDIKWDDCGTVSSEVTDYPAYAHCAVRKVLTGVAPYGILLCGTGAGMAIAANRHPGIYAALVWNEEVAKRAKEEDYANILVIPSDYVSTQQAVAMITVWLEATSKEGRYKERIMQIDTILYEGE